MAISGAYSCILFNTIDNRPGRTHIEKVKSHTDKIGPRAIQQRLIRFDHFVGNALADEVAEADAKKLQPDVNMQVAAAWYEKMGFTVAKRLAIIQAEAWAQQEQVENLYELDLISTPELLPQSVANACAKSSLVTSGHRLF